MGEQQVIFSENLKALIEERGQTQAQVADSIGVSRATINMWIKGVTFPRMPKVQRLANYFGVPVSCLVDPWPSPDRPEPMIVQWVEAEFPDLMIDKVRDLMREMNDDGKEKVLAYARDIVENDKYRFEKKGDDALCGSTDPADASAL